jgi:hypothetical protein
MVGGSRSLGVGWPVRSVSAWADWPGPLRMVGGSCSFRCGSAGLACSAWLSGRACSGVVRLVRPGPPGAADLVRFGVGWLVRRASAGLAGPARAAWSRGSCSLGVGWLVWPAPHGWVAGLVRGVVRLVLPVPRGSCLRRCGLSGPAWSAWLVGRACSGVGSAGLAGSARVGWPGLIRCGGGWFGPFRGGWRVLFASVGWLVRSAPHRLAGGLAPA